MSNVIDRLENKEDLELAKAAQRYTAVLDACVSYPAPLRDLLNPSYPLPN